MEHTITPEQITPEQMSHFQSLDRRGIARSMAIFISLLPTVFMVVRMYIRARMVRSVGWDDWMLVIAQLLVYANTGIALYMTYHGLGRSVFTLATHDVVQFFRGFYVCILLYYITLFCIKFAYIAQFMRIFRQQLRKTLYALMAFILSFHLTIVMTTVFACRPVSFYWDRTQPNGRCVNREATWYVAAAGNMATDLLFCILPVMVIWKLQVRRLEKYTLMAGFMFGMATVATSIVRIVYLVPGDDITYDGVPLFTTTHAEMACNLIAACVPTLRPLILRWFRINESEKSAGRGSGQDASDHHHCQPSNGFYPSRTKSGWGPDTEVLAASTEELTYDLSQAPAYDKSVGITDRRGSLLEESHDIEASPRAPDHPLFTYIDIRAASSESTNASQNSVASPSPAHLSARYQDTLGIQIFTETSVRAETQ